MTHVVILIPGIEGSVLKLPLGPKPEEWENVWPGMPIADILHGKFNNMDGLFNPNLVATDVIREFFYGTLIARLGNWGFHEDDATLVIGCYDWPQSLITAAGTIADLVKAAVGGHGPQTEITLLAHSMGGLVARYYLESPDSSRGPEAAQVTQLLTLATPHLGAPAALLAITGHKRQLLLNKTQVQKLANTHGFPSVYQLLPTPTVPFAWDEGLTPQPVYESATAAQLGLIPDGLIAAQKLWDGLKRPHAAKWVRYFCFLGTHQKTVTNVILGELGPSGLEPRAVEQECGGDDTVPTWSGFVPGAQRLFVGGKHGTIFRDSTLLSYLRILLRSGQYADDVEVALDKVAVDPGGSVAVLITLRGDVPTTFGELVIEPARPAGEPSGFMPTEGSVKRSRVQIAGALQRVGPSLQTLSFRFNAPNAGGHYRVSFQVEDGPSGADELFVQEPPV